MRLTVLGKSPAWQDADGACSGYLIEEDDLCLLLECGNGVFGKLRKVRDYTRTDAIVISHMHADHFFDLIPYALALVFAPRQQPVPIARWSGVENPPRPALHLPPGGLAVVNQVAAAIDLPDLIERAFDVKEYDPGEALEIGGLTIEFQAVPHYVPTWAVRMRSAASGLLAYGADCSPNDELIAFATGADLMMVEATLPRPERGGERGHLTPREAGEHASRAGARRAVLTHISDEMDMLWAKSEAEQAFGGPVELASEGAVYEI